MTFMSGLPYIVKETSDSMHKMSRKHSGVYPPRSSGAIPPPIRIPHDFHPLPSLMPSTFSFPSPLLSSTPALSPFSLPPLLNLGTWIQPRKNLANLDVRTCILMCIVYVENSH